VPIQEIKARLGHASIETTARYLAELACEGEGVGTSWIATTRPSTVSGAHDGHEGFKLERSGVVRPYLITEEDQTCRPGGAALSPSRERQRPAHKLTLDPRLLGAYDQHRVPPPASRRALPTQPPQLAGGLSRVYERAKPATTASVIPATNGTSTVSRAGFKRRSTSPDCCLEHDLQTRKSDAGLLRAATMSIEPRRMVMERIVERPGALDGTRRA